MNETQVYSMSSSTYETQSASSDETSIPKRKNRRVRTLIKSSISKYTSPSSNVETTMIDPGQCRNQTGLNEKRPFPFGQCRVCLDKATGAHYGVATCEGCKGFFKRSILRKEKYRCYFGDNCVVGADNRNRCKACRFQKCLKEGMSVEGVRMGRIPKSVKEKALAEHPRSSPDEFNYSSSPARVPSSNSNSTNSCTNEFHFQSTGEQYFPFEFNQFSFNDTDAPLPSCAAHVLPENFTIDETHLLLNNNEQLELTTDSTIQLFDRCQPISMERIKQFDENVTHPMIHLDLSENELNFVKILKQKIFDLSSTYNQRTKQLINRMNRMIDLQIEHFPGDQSSLHDIWIGLTDAIPYHVKNLIAFAREIPALYELNCDDFKKIINNRLFDFWMIKHAPLIRENQSYTMLPNGLQYTRRWMSEIIGEDMVRAIFQFADQLNSLKLTPEEYSILFPIVICHPDQTLKDFKTMEQFQNCYFYLLYNQMSSTRNESDMKDLFSHLIKVLDGLPSLNELQAKKIDPLIPMCS